MSDPGRGDGYTDLESLLRGAEAEGNSRASCTEQEAEPRETPEGGAAGESSLPFEDLLSELLVSWSDETERGAEPEADAALPAEVPLSSLMARLLEDPSPSETDLAAGDVPEVSVECEEAGTARSMASLEALGESLSSADYPPGELRLPELQEPPADATELAPAEAEAEAVSLPAEPAEASQGLCATPDDLLHALIQDELLQALVQTDEPPESWVPPAIEPIHSSGLAAEPPAPTGNSACDAAPLDPAPDSHTWASMEDGEPEPLAGLAAEEESSAGWEVLASLPAPLPPSFSETMLFEPALPAASLFQWPAVEQSQAPVSLGYEVVAFEEPDASAEAEPDDSLRRLVGQMLAELAASAAPPQRTPNAGTVVERETERFLSFSLAGEVYAVALAGILETDRLPRITRVPGLPAWAIGVTNLRGAILQVIDLRRLLNLEEAENPQDGRILVVRPSPQEPPAVVVVDHLEGVALLAQSELHPAPAWLDSKVLPYLQGIGSFKGRLVNVLDLGRLFQATGVTGDDALRVGEAV